MHLHFRLVYPYRVRLHDHHLLGYVKAVLLLLGPAEDHGRVAASYPSPESSQDAGSETTSADEYYSQNNPDGPDSSDGNQSQEEDEGFVPAQLDPYFCRFRFRIGCFHDCWVSGRQAVVVAVCRDASCRHFLRTVNAALLCPGSSNRVDL